MSIKNLIHEHCAFTHHSSESRTMQNFINREEEQNNISYGILNKYEKERLADACKDMNQQHKHT